MIGHPRRVRASVEDLTRERGTSVVIEDDDRQLAEMLDDVSSPKGFGVEAACSDPGALGTSRVTPRRKARRVRESDGLVSRDCRSPVSGFLTAGRFRTQ